jgi:protoporphyrinogen oxidase
MKKIAIIGAGFGGLTAGYRLAKSGYEVSIFEYDKHPGGLAVGFKKPNWKWTLEKHYHHLFTNDDSILKLAQEILHEIVTVRPKTSTFVGGDIYQLDSPLSLLTFPKINILDRFRTGAVLAYLRYAADWQKMEKITAKEFLIKTGGLKAWQTLWEPLFVKKFDKYQDEIPASWFWARIKKRTPSLSYPEGGFLPFAEKLAEIFIKNGGEINYKTEVKKIYKKGNLISIRTDQAENGFDKVIVTLPGWNFVKLTPDLPGNYQKTLLNAEGIGAVNMVLSLKKQFLSDNTYWLNVNATHFPFLAVVEHTNFMDKKYYGGEHLVYVGNYLPQNHPYFKRDGIDLYREFYPFLKTINPRLTDKWINKIYVFKTPFAQPILPLNYSKIMPSFKTPIKNLYLCNMSQVYPWDRGTNYAVENGDKIAKMIVNEEN